jgi:hypothetical protein
VASFEEGSVEKPVTIPKVIHLLIITLFIAWSKFFRFDWNQERFWKLLLSVRRG